MTLASRRPIGARLHLDLSDAPAPDAAALPDGPMAGRVIRQRRSLLACDGTRSISAECFYAMLVRE